MAVPGPKLFLQRGGHGLRAGELTVRGVIRPVTLEAVYLSHVAGPRGGQRAVFTADGTPGWEDWGLAWNVPPDGGALLVSKDIRIEIGLEAGAPAMTTRQPARLPQRQPGQARRCDPSFSKP